MKVGLSSEGRAGHICLYVATLYAVLGAIGGILNSVLGLEIMSWFLLVIVAFFTTFLIGWVAAMLGSALVAYIIGWIAGFLFHV